LINCAGLIAAEQRALSFFSAVSLPPSVGQLGD